MDPGWQILEVTLEIVEGVHTVSAYAVLSDADLEFLDDAERHDDAILVTQFGPASIREHAGEDVEPPGLGSPPLLDVSDLLHVAFKRLSIVLRRRTIPATIRMEVVDRRSL